MARIVLHGELAEKFNPVYTLDIASPKEAIRALCVMVPNFKDTFSEGSYYLYVKGNEQVNIDEDNFSMFLPGEIHILPEVLGAKKGGFGKVLMGIALIGLSIFTAGAGAVGAYTFLYGAGFSASAATTAFGLTVTALTNVGVALALGGAAQMLSPKIKNDSSSVEKSQSYLFNGADANIENGSCVPLIYGEVLAAGFPISFDVTDVEPNFVTADSTYNIAVGGWSFTFNQAYQV